MSVIASKFPKKVPHKLAYQTMMVREARRCGSGGWAAYDTAFQQQAAIDPTCDWSQLNSSLYSVTLMAQATGTHTLRECTHVHVDACKRSETLNACVLCMGKENVQTHSDVER